MSKLTTIDRDACRILRNAINDCLAKISDEHGIRFSAGSGSFDSGQVTFKVECALVNNGEVLSKETTDFKRYAAMFGLSPDDLGENFFTVGNDTRLSVANRNHASIQFSVSKLVQANASSFQKKLSNSL